jgi:hypothetical protein
MDYHVNQCGTLHYVIYTVLNDGKLIQNHPYLYAWIKKTNIEFPMTKLNIK